MFDFLSYKDMFPVFRVEFDLYLTVQLFHCVIKVFFPGLSIYRDLIKIHSREISKEV